ncbi:vacuolar membrane-associated protein iml1 [Ceratocystis pirilliformis]|uniref:Vacuolar membrane-associated protein IML1 n=1 Tax=Ceratocystis pirilliformis TaxID=259994 RepID=A0ABR3ZLC6_9PEZI
MSRHLPRRNLASHLRQVSRGSGDKSPLSFQRTRSPDSVASTAAHSAGGRAGLLLRRCTVTVNEGYSPDDVLLNFDLVGGEIKPGQLMAMTVVTEKEKGMFGEELSRTASGGDKTATGSTGGGTGPPGLSESETCGKRYVFVAKDMPRELKIRHPLIEVYVVKHIADNFGMKKGTSVVLTAIDPSNPVVEAGYVEMSFRDQYLSRSDMWRLAVDELTDTTVYRGQSILFMGTIKATVTSIFVGKEKVHSAFFTRNTRPVFRSESARYVLFIQMAREMWDFDAEGSGEIMFNKVVNGFLPALFKKWALLKAHHRVTIVLFARVEYNFGLSAQFVSGELGEYYTGIQPSGERRPYKDFYRVVVSEMASGEWTTILYELKKEFNYFRRDISIHHLTAPGVLTPFAAVDDEPAALNQIKAESSFAMYGNFLEAITMASVLFSHDYIDRDLNHTGVSLVIISPGPGVFEVEYETLRKTTESLIGNGIGIDLVCVPKLPLHSVPLFRYRTRQILENGKERWIRSRESTPRGPNSMVGSYISTTESVSPAKTVTGGSGHMRRVDSFASTTIVMTDEWSYAVPQWLHVAFWTGTSEEALSYQGIVLAVAGSNNGNDDSKTTAGSDNDENNGLGKGGSDRDSGDDFVIRCRMYGLQMRSVLETNEIDIAPLLSDPLFSKGLYEMDWTGREVRKAIESNGDRPVHVPELEPFDTLSQRVSGMAMSRMERPLQGSNRKIDYRRISGLLADYDSNRAKLPATRDQKTNWDGDETLRRGPGDSSSVFGSSFTDNPQGQRTGTGLGQSSRKMSINFSDIERPIRRRGSAAAPVLGSQNGTLRRLDGLNKMEPSGSGIGSVVGSLVGSTVSSVVGSMTSIAPSRTSAGTGASTSAVALQNKAPKFMRNISLGQHGFGIAAPKAAIPKPSLETITVVKAPGSQNLEAGSVAPLTSANIARPSPPLSVASQLSPRAENWSTMSGTLSTTPSIPILKRSTGSVTSLQQLQAEAAMSLTPRASAARANATNSSNKITKQDPEVVYSQMLQNDVGRMYNYKLRMGALPNMHHGNSRMQNDLGTSPNNQGANGTFHGNSYGKQEKHKNTAAVSPWLMLLNPSNPDLSKVDDATQYRLWQHVFPHTSRMRVMKWKALCCPAAVPLTTEYFPAQKEFETDWQCMPYSIAQNGDDEFISEDPKPREEFLRELISLRFSQGFQVVIGPAVARAFGQKMLKIGDIFSKDSQVEDGTSIFMSAGNSIHQLSCSNGTEIEVNIYTRKLDPTVYSSSMPAIYRPAIRTLLDHEYEHRAINMPIYRPELNWNQVDSYIAGQTEEMTDVLRFWRTRFVLIPMVARQGLQERGQNGYSCEEIRLEGIKQLAQSWQRHRFVTPTERPLMSMGSSRRRKDPNPLDIVYKTEDPSLVIAAEYDTLPLVEGLDGPRRGQHLSGRDGFRRTSLNLSALAEAIQQPVELGGIRMQNRRWHLRMHYNCFIGSDMTTWLLDNFDDLESREDAEKLGNFLMAPMSKSASDDKDKDKDKDKDDKEKGLFMHVQQRHPFRDGQYFYQITADYAKPVPQSWFNPRRKDKEKEKEPSSVPPTPLLDAIGMHREPSTTSSHSIIDESPPPPLSSGLASNMANAIHTPTMMSSTATFPSNQTASTSRMSKQKSKPKQNVKPKPIVMLSKVMKYDVDHRKRSYRPECINLHYDRLHNPDNCYHIRIDWLNTTAKLIEDAVDGWAREAANFGLRLVEVPINEASSITNQNPFRRPFRIPLAFIPPDQEQQQQLTADGRVTDSAASVASISSSSMTQTPRLAPSQPLASYLFSSVVPLASNTHRFFFHREILRRFDFVLDVEAAANFPTSVDVRYSWGSPDYRYSQYIHRTGCLLAQITEDGDFLLLQNHMFSNRGATKEKSMAVDRAANKEKSMGADRTINPAAHSHITLSHIGITDSPRLKPTFRNSPALRPVFSGSPTGEGSSSGPAGPKQAMFDIVMHEMMEFCTDEEALEIFYYEIMEREFVAQSPSLNPIDTHDNKSSRNSSLRDRGDVRDSRGKAREALEVVSDANIPSLGLPPAVLDLSELGADGANSGVGVGWLGPGLGPGMSPVQAQMSSSARLSASMALGMGLLRRASVQTDPKGL